MTLQILAEFGLWGLLGGGVGLLIHPLARLLPQQILQRACEPPELWRGPGGGVNSPKPKSRVVWIPCFNAAAWMVVALTSSTSVWATLTWCLVVSCLLLLALVDWDTTLLPDWVVVPLALAGVVASLAGLTSQTLGTSVVSALFIVLLLSSITWVYKRFRGIDGMGGGDIKLLGSLAAWWGALHVLYVLAAACVITLLWYLGMRLLKKIDKQDEWPFGPSIVIAAVLLWH